MVFLLTKLLVGTHVVEPQSHKQCHNTPLVFVILGDLSTTTKEPNLCPNRSTALYFTVFLTLQPQEVVLGFLLLRLWVSTVNSLPHTHRHTHVVRNFCDFPIGRGLPLCNTNKSPTTTPVRSTLDMQLYTYPKVRVVRLKIQHVCAGMTSSQCI